MKYPVVSTDFDGTLLRSDHTISQFTINVINEYVSKGGTFIINSGRMCKSLLFELNKTKLIDILSNGHIIGYNGAMIMKVGTKQIVYHNSIDYKVAAQLIKYVKPLVAGMQIYFDENLYCKQITPITTDYMLVTGVEATELNMELDEYILLNKQNITKLLAFAQSDVVSQQIEIIKKDFDTVTAANSISTFLEITAKNVDKSTGIMYLLNNSSLTMNNCLAFGDGGNDIQMLKEAALGVAVSNASDSVKKVADMVCESNDNDGVAKVVKQMCL